MSSQPIIELSKTLQSAGFTSVGQSVTVGSLRFEFDLAMTAKDKLDLVVAVDTIEHADLAKLTQKLQALSRALDVAGSRRNVTLILVGPPPAAQLLVELSALCRVLPLGVFTGTTGGEQFRDHLSVLLPLELPAVPERLADSAAELTRMSAEGNQATVSSLIGVAPRGAAAVRAAFVEMLGAVSKS